MYEALNEFTTGNTWPSLHWEDEERFYRGISQIVGNPDFTPQGVRAYIKRRYTLQFGDSDEADRLAHVCSERANIILRYVNAARR